jgi:hypothetical protein
MSFNREAGSRRSFHRGGGGAGAKPIMFTLAVDFPVVLSLHQARIADVEAGTPIHVFVARGILPAQLPAIT